MMNVKHAAMLLPIFLAGLAHAAGDEIQVYNSEINKPGELGLELHLNYVADGSRARAWPEQTPTHHMLRVTPEFSLGITERLELGLYIPTIKAADGGFQGEGLKGRIKYLVADDTPFYWGVNVELGRVSLRTEEAHWNTEVRPIVGYKTGRWDFTVNPIVGKSLSGNGSKTAEFEPATKVAYRLDNGVAIGIEHYTFMGPLNDMLPSSEREQNTYFVVDGKIGTTDINFGIGRGWRAAEDKLVVKAIFGFGF